MIYAVMGTLVAVSLIVGVLHVYTQAHWSVKVDKRTEVEDCLNCLVDHIRESK